MSWCTRRRGRRRARRVRASSGSVSRKLPPTIQNRSTSPSAACSIISAVVQPGVVGTSNPQTSDQRAAVAASTPGTQPISAPPCTPEWPRIGTRPAVGPPGQAAREADVHQRTDGLHAVRVLGQSHRPDEDGVRSIDQEAGEGLDAIAGRAALALDDGPVGGQGSCLGLGEACRQVADERVVDPAGLDQTRATRRRGTPDRRRCGRRTSGRRWPCRRRRSTQSTAPSSASAPARDRC